MKKYYLILCFLLLAYLFNLTTYGYTTQIMYLDDKDNINESNFYFNGYFEGDRKSHGKLIVNEEKYLTYEIYNNGINFCLYNLSENTQIKKTYTFDEMGIIYVQPFNDHELLNIKVDLKYDSKETLFIISWKSAINDIILNENLEVIDRINKIEVDLTPAEAEKFIDRKIVTSPIENVLYADDNIIVFICFPSDGFRWGYYVYNTAQTFYYFDKNFRNFRIIDSYIIFDTIVSIDAGEYFTTNSVTMFNLDTYEIKDITFPGRSFLYENPLTFTPDLKYFMISTFGEKYDERILEIFNIETGEKVKEYTVYITKNIREKEYYSIEQIYAYANLGVLYLSDDLNNIYLEVIDSIYNDNYEGSRKVFSTSLLNAIEVKENPSTSDTSLFIFLLLISSVVFLYHLKNLGLQ